MKDRDGQPIFIGVRYRLRVAEFHMARPTPHPADGRTVIVREIGTGKCPIVAQYDPPWITEMNGSWDQSCFVSGDCLERADQEGDE